MRGNTMNHGNDAKGFIAELRKSAFSVLLLDYDGTLAPFSLDRDIAVPYPGVRALLQNIADSGSTRIVILTGRDATQIGPLLQVRPAPEVWGAHGLQRLLPGGNNELPELDTDAMHALANAERWLAYQGFLGLAEHKPGSLAVHWRGLDRSSAAALRDKVIQGWSALTRNYPFTILEFDGGLELRLETRDKAFAIRTILSETPPESPVAYLGDDSTDEPAFRLLRDRGLTVLVGKSPRRTSAEIWLRPPEELLDFLSLWRDAMQKIRSRHFRSIHTSQAKGSYLNNAYDRHRQKPRRRNAAA
jgi:trehalose 6-phosphate phosphatase